MEPFFSSPKQQGLEPLVVPLSPGHRSGEPAPVGESSKSFSIDGKPISEWKLVAQTAGPLLLAVAGSGLAPLPCAFSLAGIPAGIATLITLALLNDYTSIILVKAAVWLPKPAPSEAVLTVEAVPAQGRAHTYGYEEIMLKGGGTLAQVHIPGAHRCQVLPGHAVVAARESRRACVTLPHSPCLALHLCLTPVFPSERDPRCTRRLIVRHAVWQPVGMMPASRTSSRICLPHAPPVSV